MSARTAREWSGPVFFFVALLWLPVGLILSALLRGFGFDGAPDTPAGLYGDYRVRWPQARALLAPFLSLVVVAPAGLPLALACRQLRRLGYARTTWVAAAVLAPATVAASLVAGLLGPLAIAIYAVMLSLPVWIAVAVLRRRR